MDLLMWLISAFVARYGIYFVAVSITHFADLRLGTSCALAWLKFYPVPP